MKNILTGGQILTDFINNNAVYVDKTPQILKLFTESYGPYFFSRPRRFGKSLLLDTIKEIASGNRDLFRNLAIGQPDCDYDWKPFPVIKLNMSSLDVTPSLFKDKLISKLNNIAKDVNLYENDYNSVSDISDLIHKMSQRHAFSTSAKQSKSDVSNSNNVVLLIDEYDFPIINNIGKSENEIQLITDTLYPFYTAIKASAEDLRFTFITGVTKFAQISLFSSMNTIKDITLSSKYSTLCGFTDRETKDYFEEHLESTLNNLKSLDGFESDATVGDLMKQVVEYYDGYSWDGVSKVLNPYSVSNFFYEQAFGDFWIQSGESLLVSKLNLQNDIYFRAFADSCVVDTVLPASNVGDLDGPSIMLQTGYLTVDKKSLSVDNKYQYTLKTPNKEVANALTREYIRKELSFPKGSDYIDSKYEDFYDAFINQKQSECELLFSSFLAEIPVHIFHRIEFVPQILLYTYLNIHKYSANMETYVGEGRADIMFSPNKDTKFIIEMKYRKSCETSPTDNSSDKIQTDIEKAHVQIDLNKYALPFVGHVKNIYTVAVVVQGQTDVRFSFREFDPSQYFNNYTVDKSSMD
ncbi:MAG: ATP-binding protein [Deltaproteobacteria bacterium]|jgi:hypothetical protein|nr:ATP-binding protein [Deltaproteobacteria bacterium]